MSIALTGYAADNTAWLQELCSFIYKHKTLSWQPQTPAVCMQVQFCTFFLLLSKVSLTSSSDGFSSSSVSLLLPRPTPDDCRCIARVVRTLLWLVLGLIGSVKLAVDWSTPPFRSRGGEKCGLRIFLLQNLKKKKRSPWAPDSKSIYSSHNLALYILYTSWMLANPY